MTVICPELANVFVTFKLVICQVKVGALAVKLAVSELPDVLVTVGVGSCSEAITP